RRPRGRQRDVMGAALQQPDPELTLQPLHLLAQRGLHDVLARRGAAEVQLLGEDNEITKLAQLHACHHLPLCGPLPSKGSYRTRMPEPPREPPRHSPSVIGPGNGLCSGCLFPPWRWAGWLSIGRDITKGEGHVIIPDRSMAMSALAGPPNGSAPRCEHLAGLSPVVPRSDYCPDCRLRGSRWKTLLVCLTCGWVACGG